MSQEQFLGATRSKVQGTQNLHEYLPQDLDFFVMLSSIAGVGGSRGQGNYAAGNTYQDALAHHRRRRGLKACTIDVGMVLGVGFLANETTDDRVYENMNSWIMSGIREREFLGVLQAAILGRSVDGAAAVPAQMSIGLGTGGMWTQAGKEDPYYFRDAKFAHLASIDTHQLVQKAQEDSIQLGVQLARAANVDQATEVVAEAMVKKLARSMMVPVEDIDASRSVSNYGVDSLLAVEIRAWIFSEMKADISVFDLLSKVAIRSLSRKIVYASKIVIDEVKAVE